MRLATVDKPSPDAYDNPFWIRERVSVFSFTEHVFTKETREVGQNENGSVGLRALSMNTSLIASTATPRARILRREWLR